ncbi:MAG TPA: GNAT family N-acetyltransferase [Thermoleophilaceae bacterium]
MTRQLEGGFELDTERSRVDLDEVARFLSEDSYWARGRSRETMERLLREAQLVVGIYKDGRQAAFCRVVTDGVAFAYLADVYVHPDFRGRGLGVELVRAAVENGPYSDVRWLLGTEDAHSLYEKVGFRVPSPRIMERPPAKS